ncbi:hypothetical protein WR25_03845 [Diploscapter pachys]|uniref:Uncharacterized protein n=1 Tax=Diploscapter pachys TaxID=2018661 RepID=A0A2A2KE14_9BILA|nr:hypothetical protein WR25_03845 [Diploscapter pachys]
MVVGVVEHQRLALRPADDAVADAHADVAVARHDEAEVAGDQPLGGAAPDRVMRARRQDGERGAVEAGDGRDDAVGLRAGGGGVAVAAPQRHSAVGGGGVGGKRAHRFVADRAPVIAQQGGPGELAHVEHRIGGDQRRGGDHAIDPAAQARRQVEPTQQALRLWLRRGSRGEGARIPPHCRCRPGRRDRHAPAVVILAFAAAKRRGRRLS